MPCDTHTHSPAQPALPICRASPFKTLAFPHADYRPTPLEHYVFPGGGDGLFLAVDSKGTFRQAYAYLYCFAQALLGG